MELEREHEELLSLMVEATRAVPRAERRPFILVKAQGPSVLLLHGLPGNAEVPQSDLDDLCEVGLLRRGFGSQGSPNYEVTRKGFVYYEEMKGRHAGQVERVEDEVRHYLVSETLTG